MKQKAKKFECLTGPTMLEPGDRILVKNTGLIGRHKLAARWKETVYVVVKKPSPGLPIYCVQPEGGGKQKILHRNMLFPIGSASPLPDQNKTPKIVKSTPTIPPMPLYQYRLL